MINWHEVPFIKLLLPLIVGVWLGIYIDICFPFGNVLLCVIVVIFCFFNARPVPFQYRFLSATFVNLALFLLGFQLATHHNELHHTQHFQTHITRENTFIGTIAEQPSIQKTVKLILDIQQIKKDDEWVDASGKLLVYQELDTLSATLNYGDQLLCVARINPIEDSGNPYAFDFSRYNHFKNIHYQSYVRIGGWQLAAANDSWSIFALALQARKRFISILKKHLYTANELAVGSALVLGYKDILTDEIRNAYTGTGAMHVLAVSGLHVGIVMYLLGLLLAWLPVNSMLGRYLKTAFIIVGIWAFALLTGGSPSVLRAATMFSFVVLGQQLRLSNNIYNSLAASAFLLICYNPFIIMDVGFQLSYLAVIGIVFYQSKVYNLWYIENRIGNYIWKLSTVAIAAQITTLPISLFYFHQFPVYFFLSGLVVVPAAGFILVFGIGLFFFEIIFPSFAWVIGNFLYGLIWSVNALIFFIQQLPYSLITGIWIGVLAMLCLYFFVLGMTMFTQTNKPKWAIMGLSCLLLFGMQRAFIHYQNHTQSSLTVYHLNKNSLIDFKYKTANIALQSEFLEESDIVFSAQNNRWATGIQNTDNQTFKNDSIQTNVLIKQDNLIQYFDKKIFIINPLTNFSQLPVGKIDILFLKDSPYLDLQELAKKVKPKLVLFDGSNSRRSSKEWVSICEAYEIPYHDTRSMGAYVWKVKQ